jgi:GxxExxY protein
LGGGGVSVDKHRFDINSVSEKIIGCAFTVSNTLGCGFLEKIYENAMAIECIKQGLKVNQQKGIEVTYDNQTVGEYFADLIIEDCVIVELKAQKNLDEIHMAQIMNYLKATKLKLGLLINFGKPRVEFKRVVNGL